MKKFIFSIIMMLLCVAVFGQNTITVNGNVIKTEKSIDNAAVDTGYVWDSGKTDENGKVITYPIFATKSGACFVIRVSKNTGKEYRQYLGKDASAEIIKLMRK